MPLSADPDNWRLMEMFHFIQPNIWDMVDILIVSFVAYRMLLLIKGTRAFQMLVGLFVILLAYAGSQVANLYTMRWILESFLGFIILVIVILFQSDIRRALTQVGRNPFFSAVSKLEETQVLEEVIRAAKSMGSRKIGALIVLERETNLDEFIEVGTVLDAKVTKEIVTSIFLPYSAIHDGAVVIRAGRIYAAGCFLPLTTSTEVSKSLGSRHRAAMGITQETDSVVIVASEESGKLSLVVKGVMSVDMDVTTLRVELQKLF